MKERDMTSGTKKPLNNHRKIGIRPGGSVPVAGIGEVRLSRDSRTLTIIPENQSGSHLTGAPPGDENDANTTPRHTD